MLAKITSLFDLFNKARTDKRYELLAIVSAKNLGGSVQTLEEAEKWLNLTANDVGDCRGVVEEVNFCRDLVEKVTGSEPVIVKKKSPKFKVIKERDVIDSNNYIRFQWTAPSMTYSDALQELGRVQRQAQEQNVAVMTAQQQPSNNEGIVCRPNSPYLP